MHEWFAQVLAGDRMAAARQRSMAHHLRVAGRRGVGARLLDGLRGAATRRASSRRHVAASPAVVAADCC